MEGREGTRGEEGMEREEGRGGEGRGGEGRGGEGRGGEGRGGEGREREGRGGEGRERREGRKVESKHSSLWQSRREEWKEDSNGLLHGTLTLAVCVVGRGSVGRAAGWNIQS